MRRTPKTRPKPKVADANHSQAKENIQTKIAVISSAIKPQSGALVPVNDAGYEVSMAIRELLPTTVRQFNQWQSDDLPDAVRIKLPNFRRNANKTLHTACLYEDVKRAVEAVSYARVKATSDGRAERIVAYKAKADLAIRLREIAEDELIRLKKELLVARDQLDVLNRKLDELRSRVRDKSNPVDIK